MKKLFIPLLAAVAFVSCSDNEPTPVVDPTTQDDISYVAVNIVQPGQPGANSKAAGATTTDGKFQYGSDAENYAQQGLFFIFNVNEDGAGTIVGNAQRLALTGVDTETTEPAVEKIYSAVLVIDGVQQKPTGNLQIVCILNAPAGLENGVSTLSGLTAKIGNYDAHTKGTFIMSNSVYRENGVKVLGAKVGSVNLRQSSAEALANPVQIFVERVVAKVEVDTKGPAFAYETMKPNVDGVETSLYINIKGLEIANIADNSYLLKSISDTPEGISKYASDPTNKRSYWETCPPTTSSDPNTPTLGYLNQSYNVINKAVTGFNIETATLTQYIQPNTTDQKTSVLVTAQLTTDEAGEKPFSFIYLKGGYFTPDNAGSLLASYMANNYNYWYKTGTTDTEITYTQLPASAFTWKNKYDFKDVTLTPAETTAINNLADYEVIGRLVTTGEGAIDVNNLYKYNATTKEYVSATAAEINEDLLNYVAEYWNDGMCYYFMEIDQTPALVDNGYTLPQGTTPWYGVVRNHIYKLTLSSIRGLGTPVFDPDDVIVPVRRTEDDLWYLAAEVRVLAWKVSKQNVAFDM